jgi:hypothetical protein
MLIVFSSSSFTIQSDSEEEMVDGSFLDEKEKKKCKLPPQAHPIRQAFAGDDVEAKPVLGMRNWKLKMKRILK